MDKRQNGKEQEKDKLPETDWSETKKTRIFGGLTSTFLPLATIILIVTLKDERLMKSPSQSGARRNYRQGVTKEDVIRAMSKVRLA